MKKYIYYISIFLIISFLYSCDHQKKEDAGDEVLHNMVERIAPWMNDKIYFTIDSSGNGPENFKLKTNKGKVYITANSRVAAATGFNWYLKYYCHRSISHTGENLAPPDTLPAIKDSVLNTSKYPIRYALNYCTINYTMSFWDWPRWEKELDWMAMNGINLMLAPLGNEIVWRNIFLKLGFNKSVASSYSPGPAFTAWWLMGNLEGWQGPLSDDFMIKQMELQQKILLRCKELGINPVVQGFYGMVPTFLKDSFPKANIISQGKWEGGFERSDFLDPADTLFQRMSTLYYEEMQNLYGHDLHYFGGDPFHEGGKSGELDLKKSAQLIYKSVNNYFPEPVWVLQAWQGNPKPVFLSGFNKGEVLVLDLFGESDNYWEQRKGYEGHDWLWCMINNFGEKTGMIGKLRRLTQEPLRALNSPSGSNMKGIGIIPEGINNNAIVYDLFLETAWRDQPIDLNDWIRNYAFYRYGVNDPALNNAWSQLLLSVYSSPENYNILGPAESVMLARPSLQVKSVSTWGNTTLFYDTFFLYRAAKDFISVANKYWNLPAFRFDCVDVCRQLLSDRSYYLYDQIINDYKKKDKAGLNTDKFDFLHLILQQDSLCSLEPLFTLSHWLDQAINSATNEKEKKLFVKNAKVQVSYWGPLDKKSSLIDYANKQWSGMLRSYYYNRWKMFFDELTKNYLNGSNKEPLIDFFPFEKKWSEDPDIYSDIIDIPDKQAFLKRIITKR